MEADVKLQSCPEGTVIDVRAQPRASRSEVVGPRAGALQLRITDPPVDGAANAAIVRLMSDYLNVSRSDVEIVGGATSKRKRVLVRGLSTEDVRRRLTGR